MRGATWPAVPLCDTMCRAPLEWTRMALMLPTPTKRTARAAVSMRATATAAPRVGAKRRCSAATISSQEAWRCGREGLDGGFGGTRGLDAVARAVSQQQRRSGLGLAERPVVAADLLARIGRQHGTRQHAASGAGAVQDSAP